ncbi:quinolinate synthase NadA [endosymbiont 'TC1' of Trimyema compressum]|uniref:quinolinate synthase NadA n=1 Tax=endosymbiont 'TC1' of Trimyema compressum TaxID=243899 RepID=UPI00316AE912
MADMADINALEIAWEKLSKIYGIQLLPITYVNSTASIKGFVGAHGGATITSGNAESVLRWALKKERLSFLPDEYLGRNTAFKLGVSLDEMAVWNPFTDCIEGNEEGLKIILWKGFRFVHKKFTIEDINRIRKTFPEMAIAAHPECTFDVVQNSDFSGSANAIINVLKEALAGSQWAIGTEANLVNRLIAENPDKTIIHLSKNESHCDSMNKITLVNLREVLEGILEKNFLGVIKVDEALTKNAVKALNRMMTIK